MNTIQISREFKGVFIKREVWLNPNLTPLEKMLVAEIDSFSNADRGCIASNAYLAQFFGVSEGRMAHMITDLRKKGFVETSSFNGRDRCLRLTSALSETSKAALSETVNSALSDSDIAYTREKKVEKEGFRLQPELPKIKTIKSGAVNGTKPTQNEVVMFFVSSLSLPVTDGEWFFHSMEAGGWMRGKAPVKNWHAHARSWKLASIFPSQKQQSSFLPQQPVRGRV